MLEGNVRNLQIGVGALQAVILLLGRFALLQQKALLAIALHIQVAQAFQSPGQSGRHGRSQQTQPFPAWQAQGQVQQQGE